MSKTTLNPFENARRTAGGSAGGVSANNVSFDNSLTELVSENVQGAIEEVADEAELAINAMTANDGVIFMDYHDGQYGYNTDESRGADTFHPFSNGIDDYIVRDSSSTSGESKTFNISKDVSQVLYHSLGIGSGWSGETCRPKDMENCELTIIHEFPDSTTINGASGVYLVKQVDKNKDWSFAKKSSYGYSFVLY